MTHIHHERKCPSNMLNDSKCNLDLAIQCCLTGSLEVNSPNNVWSEGSFRHYQDKHDCFMNQLFEERSVS